MEPPRVFAKLGVVQVLEKIIAENRFRRPHRFVSLVAGIALLLRGSVKDRLQDGKFFRKSGVPKNTGPDFVRPDQQVAGQVLTQAKKMIAGLGREFEAFAQQIERLEFVDTVLET